MRNDLFDTISNEEYEQIRQAGKVLADFLQKHKGAYRYDEIVISSYGGMALRKESIEYMNVNKTREEDKAATEELIKEWTSNG